MVSTDDLWEVRVQAGSDIFRLLGFFDGPSRVVLAHGFQKKTRKTPRPTIRVAEERKRDYFRKRETGSDITINTVLTLIPGFR